MNVQIAFPTTPRMCNSLCTDIRPSMVSDLRPTLTKDDSAFSCSRVVIILPAVVYSTIAILHVALTALRSTIGVESILQKTFARQMPASDVNVIFRP